ncbi:Naringenin [Abeliophyllum distichum]|uniref:Naringenin n=1 Tax=Abeliophyllum distichum TaxID=126358 RepID=A0ABD1V7D7_9LAMI
MPPRMVARHRLLSNMWMELLWLILVTLAINGRFKNANHQAVVNSNYSRLSIATFQNSAQEAIVYPLKIKSEEKSVLDEPITSSEMYKRKMSKDLELAKLKKLVKDKQLKQETNVKSESVEEILA